MSAKLAGTGEIPPSAEMV